MTFAELTFDQEPPFDLLKDLQPYLPDGVPA